MLFNIAIYSVTYYIAHNPDCRDITISDINTIFMNTNPGERYWSDLPDFDFPDDGDWDMGVLPSQMAKK